MKNIINPERRGEKSLIEWLNKATPTLISSRVWINYIATRFNITYVEHVGEMLQSERNLVRPFTQGTVVYLQKQSRSVHSCILQDKIFYRAKEISVCIRGWNSFDSFKRRVRGGIRIEIDSREGKVYCYWKKNNSIFTNHLVNLYGSRSVGITSITRWNNDSFSMNKRCRRTNFDGGSADDGCSTGRETRAFHPRMRREDRVISVAATAPSFVDIFCPSWPSRRTRRWWIHGSDIIIPSQPGDVACNYSLPRRPSSPITIEAEPRNFSTRHPSRCRCSISLTIRSRSFDFDFPPVIVNNAENSGRVSLQFEIFRHSARLRCLESSNRWIEYFWNLKS